jgi:hypothetical protein
MNASSPKSTDGNLRNVVSADRWFEALDQRRVGADANSWIIQVHGVHCEQDGLWIQISSTDDPFSTIVLHLATDTPINDVLTALEHHDRPLDGRPAIVDLAAWPSGVSLNAGAASLLYPQRPH